MSPIIPGFLETPAAVLFDWDGVVVDTEEEIFESLQETFSHFGLPTPTRSYFYKCYGYSIVDAFKRDFGDQWQEARKVYYDLHARKNIRYPEIFQDVQEFLECLSKKNIYCAVVSNKNGDILRKEAEDLNLAHYFSKIVGAQDALRAKPFPDPVYHALKGTDLEPSSHPIWFIGDRSVDMECAHATKCIAIEAAFSVSKIEKESKHPPHLTINSYQDLIKILN